MKQGKTASNLSSLPETNSVKMKLEALILEPILELEETTEAEPDWAVRRLLSGYILPAPTSSIPLSASGVSGVSPSPLTPLAYYDPTRHLKTGEGYLTCEVWSKPHLSFLPQVLGQRAIGLHNHTCAINHLDMSLKCDA